MTLLKKIASAALGLSLIVLAQTPLKAQIGESLNFDGSNDYIQRTETNFSTNDLTIELWLKPTSFSNQGYLVSNRTDEFSGPGYWYLLGVQQSSGLLEFVGGAGAFGGGWGVVSAVSLTTGVWQHIAAVRKGTEYSIYINGVLRARSTDAYGLRDLTSQSGNNTTYIGAWGPPLGQRYFNGNMDELRIWSVARTQCQIQTFMNAEVPTTATSLSSNYHFNQGTASGTNTAVTSLTTSAGSTNGTLNNFALSGSGSNWVSPGGVTSGYTTTSAPSASILVTGNSNSLTPGSSSTSTLNFTNFGTSATRTFVIQNSGSGTLNVYPPYFTGPNAAEFTLTTAPALTLASASTTSFVVAFTSTVGGLRTTTINIPSNDCGVNTFSCAIGGTSTAAALDFDGNNNRVLIPSGITLNNQSFSVEFWAKRTSTLNGYVVGQGNSVAANQALHIGFRAGNVFTFAFYSNDINYTTTATSDGAYHHWACVYDASITGAKNRFVYLDGVLVASDISPSAYLNTGQTVLGDAGYYSGFPNPLTGTIDEVRIWGIARTQCDVQKYMRCEITSTASGLIANYHFNQGTPFGANSGVTTGMDATGNHNGTLSGFSLSGTTSNWIIPGGVLSGSVTPAVTAHTLNVKGNGNLILAGSATPTLSNFTDFGSATTRTLVVQNIGTGTLYLNGGVFSGANASNFSVSTIPSTLLTSGVSSNLVITFTPTAVGSQSAILSIYSSDCTNPTYSFVVTASTSPAAALNFDGNNDYVSIARPLPLTDFTNEMWFKTTTSNGGLFVSTDAASIGSVSYWDKSIFLSGGNLAAYLWNSGPTETIVTSGTNFADGNWHHVAHVVGASGQKLYVDGLLRASGSFTTSGFSNSHVFLGQAIYATSNYVNGQIDELRCWHVARTQCEIQTYMNCEIPGTVTNILSNYHFNQGVPSGANTSVTSLIDATGSVNGSLSGFALTAGSVSNWVIPGAVVSGFTISAAPTASISLSGNSNNIPNNLATASTSTLNGTAFTSAGTFTFVVTNSNTGTLNVGTPFLTGPNASEFSITVLPSTTLTASATSSFVVAFTPTAGGIRTASIGIYSNDCTIPIFKYAITGHASFAEALSIDGADDLANRPILSNNTTNVTLQAKVYWYGSTGLNQMIMYNGNSSSTGYGIYNFSGSGNLQIIMGGVSFTPFNYTLSPNVWTSLSLVLRNGMAECYVNGVLTNLANPGTPGVPTGSFTIGNNSYSLAPEGFNGKLDEVRFWNKALSQCEIQTYLDCEIPGAMPNLLGNYHLNQGAYGLDNTSITTATDASGNSNDLTLSGFALTGTVSNWVSPGAIVSGYTTTMPPTASISLTGNANLIPNNLSLASTSTLNFTDFGASYTRTFVITNSNSGTLNIGSPYLTGANASEFSITILPSATLSASATTSFVIAFTPTAGGVKSATLNIINNDCSVPIFNFAIKATVPPAAALDFDGVDDYINVPSNNIPIGNSDFTYEFWVKLKSAQTGHRWISSLGATATGSLLTIGFDGSNSNKIRVHHYGPDLSASTAAIPGNAWTHVAVNYRGNNFSSEIYINGSYVETLNFGVAMNLPANPVFQIGTFTSIGSFCPDMELDEFRVWNRALCQTEIQNNMNCEIATTAPGLVANYHFNQGYSAVDNTTVTGVTDVSGSANTGTLSGFASTGSVSNWVAPGAVTSGSSCTIYLDPEINIQGNAVNIPSGASTPTVNNFTDFGSLCSNTLIVRSFSIQNTGTGALSISSFSMSGPNASLFSIGALSPAPPIAAGGSASFNVTLTPLTSGLKTATLNIASNDCDEAAYTFVLSGTSNSLPVVSALTSHSVICNTASTSVSGSGADTYTWTGVIPVINGAPFNPSVTATYSVTGTNTLTGCTSTNAAVVTITVNALPTVSISVPSNSVCPGNSATLIASGGDTYTWTPGPLNTVTINPIPSSNTTYTLVGTNTLTGCSNTNLAVQTISITAPPTVSITAASSSICAGSQATLIASGANTYSWSPGNLTTTTVNPQPSATTVYSLIGVSATGCTSSNTATLSITVNALPTVSISTSSSAICVGASATLSASGAVIYSWSPGTATSSSIVASPANTITYTLTGKDASGCTSTNSPVLTLTVNALPTVTASASSSLICFTATTSLIGQGADTYTWLPSAINSASISPASTTNYTLTGTNTLTGCSSTNLAVQTISVLVGPVISLNSSTSSVCPGAPVILTGANASTYTFQPGMLSGTSVTVTPASTIIYTLTGSSPQGCASTNTPTLQITVNTLPNVTLSASSMSVCIGHTTALTAGGASNYTLSGNIQNGVAFTPTLTNDYTVSGSDANGCVNTASITIAVNGLPTLNIVSSTSLLCEASQATLTATGALSYVWSTSQNSTELVITPTITTSYSVTGSDLNGCENVASFTQSVTPCPGSVTAVASSSDVTCGDKLDGRISIASTNTYSNSSVFYLWSSNAGCPSSTCSSVDNLSGGNYSVTVIVTYTLNNILVKQDSVVLAPILIRNENGPCSLKIFNGVSANGDGVNDTWQIENIQEYPKNKVTVFNRWGVKVFEVQGYDNVQKVWPTGSDLQKVGSNTYFYIIDLGDGSKPIKGWIDLNTN